MEMATVFWIWLAGIIGASVGFTVCFRLFNGSLDDVVDGVYADEMLPEKE